MITEGQVLDIAKDAIYYIIICSAPVLIISLVVGLIISIFQTVTSIQEQTLTFVPKIVAVFIGLMVCGYQGFESRRIRLQRVDHGEASCECRTAW